MKISVVSEGTRDVGREGEGGHRGAVCVIVERLLGVKEGVDVYGRRLSTLHGRGGLRKKVHLSIIAAHLRGDDGVAVVVDNDGEPPSKRRGALTKGSNDADVPIPRALGLAIEEEEAWMLADEVAVSEALRLEVGIPNQPDPEKIQDPKKLLNDVSGKRVTGADLEGIANALDIEKVTKRCPKGFRRFVKEVRHNLMPIVQEHY